MTSQMINMSGASIPVPRNTPFNLSAQHPSAGRQDVDRNGELDPGELEIIATKIADRLAMGQRGLRAFVCNIQKTKRKGSFIFGTVRKLADILLRRKTTGNLQERYKYPATSGAFS